MFANRIKLDDELFRKVKECAAKQGYASPEEFVIHTLEKEVARLLDDAGDNPEEEVKKRLQGLGYID